jgi:hypothetical protein
MTSLRRLSNSNKMLIASRAGRIAATVILVALLFLVWIEVIPVWKPLSTPLELRDPIRDVYIQAIVSTTDPAFAAGVPVTVQAVGSIGTAAAGGSGFENVSVLKTIVTVCLAFSDAHTVRNGQVIMNPARQPTDGAVCLTITNVKPKEHLSSLFGPGAYLAADSATIEWLKPTESIPSMMIYYWGFVRINGVARESTSYSDPTQTVHVEPSSANQTDKTILKSPVEGMVGLVITLLQAIPWAINKRKQPNTKSAKQPSRHRAKSRR